jgi:ATP-dependent DNA ligase
VTEPLSTRRLHLENFFRTLKADRFALSAQTAKLAKARRWLLAAGSGFDGVIAKRADLPYQAGSRDGMQKIK